MWPCRLTARCELCAKNHQCAETTTWSQQVIKECVLLIDCQLLSSQEHIHQARGPDEGSRLESVWKWLLSWITESEPLDFCDRFLKQGWHSLIKFPVVTKKCFPFLNADRFWSRSCSITKWFTYKLMHIRQYESFTPSGEWSPSSWSDHLSQVNI